MSIIRQFNRYSKIITQPKERGGAQAMLYALGLKKQDMNKPQVGICSMWYEGNPCNVGLNNLSQNIKQSVISHNLLPFIFNTIGVSDGMSMGTSGMNYSLPSRDIIADSIETIMKGQHYDSLVCVPGCDKNLPGAAMAMMLLNRPSILVYGGSMKPTYLNEIYPQLDIVSAFEAFGKYINNEICDQEREQIIQNSCNKGCGSCSGFYTANTMACILEVMGLTLPNSSSNMHDSNEKYLECLDIGKYIQKLLYDDLKPLDIINKKSFENAIKMLYITGGSTNAVIHLLAMANVANINLTLDDFRKHENIPVLLNMKPHGEYVMNDLYLSGGTSVLINYLIQNNIIDGDCLTVTGKTLKENVKNSEEINTNIIFPIKKPFHEKSHIKILKGNLAPEGCIAKLYNTLEDVITKKAIVFDSEKEMLCSLENGKINVDHFIIIRYQGESTGCPEMLSPTSAIMGYFGDKEFPALGTDGRFSGGSRGTLVAHLPDAYKENSITALIKDDDNIIINLKDNSIKLDVSKDELYIRNGKIIKPNLKLNGYLKKFSKLVGNIENGYSTN